MYWKKIRDSIGRIIGISGSFSTRNTNQAQAEYDELLKEIEQEEREREKGR